MLYGVNDIKRMIDKSESSQYFFKQDIKYKNNEKNNTNEFLQNEDAEKQKKKKVNLFKNIKDFMKPERLIISQ